MEPQSQLKRRRRKRRTFKEALLRYFVIGLSVATVVLPQSLVYADNDDNPFNQQFNVNTSLYNGKWCSATVSSPVQ